MLFCILDSSMNAPTKEEAIAVLQAYSPLNARLRAITSPRPLLLAHYTSIQVIEQILKKSEIWLSNPFYMNDLAGARHIVGLNRHMLESKVCCFNWLDHHSGGQHDKPRVTKAAIVMWPQALPGNRPRSFDLGAYK